MMNTKSIRWAIPLILSILSIITIVIAEIFHQIHSSKNVPLIWLASIFVTVSTIFARFFVIDTEKFSQIIQNTNPFSKISLKPKRFLNFIVISMLIGLIATISLAFDFIIGMLFYLITQISLIISFSGILTLNVFEIKKNPDMYLKYLVSIIFWTLTIPIIYFLLIFNGLESLVVIPYVMGIGTMACISWFGLAYKERSLLFRILIAAGSILFVYSDTLIGNAKFGTFRIPLGITIDITYVIGILFISHSMLFLRDKTGIIAIK